MNKKIVISMALCCCLFVTACENSMMEEHPVDKNASLLEVSYVLAYLDYLSKPFTSVSGRVILCSLNNTGNPNVNVKLAGFFETLSTFTDSNGNFNFSNVRTSTFTLSATKDQFQFEPNQQTINISTNGVNNITIESLVTWRKTMSGNGYDKGYTAVQTNDCGYVISGFSDSATPGNFNWEIIKLDMLAQSQMWKVNYGGSYSDFAYSGCLTADGNVVVAGGTESYGQGLSDGMVMKFDQSTGNQFWPQPQLFGGTQWDELRSIVPSSDGNYLIAAGSNASDQPGGNLDQYWILKLNTSDGSEVWEKTYSTPEPGKAYSVIEDISDNSYIAVGFNNVSLDQGGGSEITVLKYRGNSNGDLVWSQTYKKGLYNEGYGICQAPDGYIITGYTKQTDFDYGNVWVFKITKDGNLTPVWDKEFDYGDISKGQAIRTTSDGNLAITGFVHSSKTDFDILVMKLSPTGEKMWDKTYDGSANREDRGYDIRETSDHGFLVTGFTETNSKYDIWILKLNKDGNIIQ